MFVSVRRYTIGAGSIDALAHRLEEEFAPAIRWRAQRVRTRRASQMSPVLVVGATGRTGRQFVGDLRRPETLADVCARLLVLEDAREKTFEVVASHRGAGRPLESAIADLKPDRATSAATRLPA